MRARSLSSLFAAALLFAAAGCGGSDNPAAPSAARIAPTQSAQHSLLLGSPTAITPLKRTTPLASNITVSKNIGILGGTISIPQAGLTVVFPALALTSTKTITITALAGSNVAYTFQPHGITFVTPLLATQSLKSTQAATGGLINPLSLQVGYFTDDTNVSLVSELLTVGVNLLNQTSTVSLWHFSGYIWASGFADGL